MTDDQFAIMCSLLKEIKKSVDRLMGAPEDKNKYDMSDLYNELDNITRAVGNLDK